jgi:hypothetical protein
MKKVIGYILVIIPVLNLIGKIGAAGSNRGVSTSPISIILLLMMFVGGIILITNSPQKKDEETQSKDIVKKDD